MLVSSEFLAIRFLLPLDCQLNNFRFSRAGMKRGNLLIHLFNVLFFTELSHLLDNYTKSGICPKYILAGIIH